MSDCYSQNNVYNQGKNAAPAEMSDGNIYLNSSAFNIWLKENKSENYRLYGVTRFHSKVPEIKLYEDGEYILTYVLENKADEDFTEKYFHFSVIMVDGNEQTGPFCQIDGFVSDSETDDKCDRSNIGYRMELYYMKSGGAKSAFSKMRQSMTGLIGKGLKEQGRIIPRNVRLVGVCPECGRSITFNAVNFPAMNAVPCYSDDGVDVFNLSVYEQPEDKDNWSTVAGGKTFRYYNSFRCKYCGHTYIDGRYSFTDNHFGMTGCLYLDHKIFGKQKDAAMGNVSVQKQREPDNIPVKNENNDITDHDEIYVVWFNQKISCPLLDRDKRVWILRSKDDLKTIAGENIGKKWPVGFNDITTKTIRKDKIQSFFCSLYFYYGCKEIVDGNTGAVIDISKYTSKYKDRFDKSKSGHEVSNPEVKANMIFYNQLTFQTGFKASTVDVDVALFNVLKSLRGAEILVPSMPVEGKNEYEMVKSIIDNGNEAFSLYTDRESYPKKYKDSKCMGRVFKFTDFIESAKKENLNISLNPFSEAGGFLIIRSDFDIITAEESEDDYRLAKLLASDGDKALKQNDKLSAVEIYGKAAELGDAHSQNNLAFLISNGYGNVKPDMKTALYWLEKASDEIADAAFSAGRIYDVGADGVPRDHGKMKYYYEKAAAMNHPAAIYNIGSMYWNGDEGYIEDRAKALALFRKSASLGNKTAQEVLEKIGG